MDAKEILNFIEIEDGRLKKRFNELDEEKHILARAVKLSEEVGELCEEVLSHRSLQRKEKLDEHDKSNISEEFIDVIFTTLLLAKAMNVDVEPAFEKKIDKINKRYA